LNNGFTELPREEELKYEDMAQNSTGHGRAAIPLVLNESKTKKFPSWDERLKELVDFKKINGHANVPQRSGRLGRWVSYQRFQYHLLKKGKHSQLSIDKCEKLESIGFTFRCRSTLNNRFNKKPKKKYPSWDERFQELVDFKNINGHVRIPIRDGQLGRWVSNQRRQFYLTQQGKYSQLTIDKCVQLESIGIEFKQGSCLSWD
jgi:hypothetical protein